MRLRQPAAHETTIVSEKAGTTVGFVILSHEADGKLARLIGALDREYGAPPIIIHHDFSQAPRDRGEFGGNVRFAHRWRKTGWAKWGVVEGTIGAIGELFADGGPDWFFLLSASDYPAMRGADVKSALASANCDAFIDLWPLDPDVAAKAKLVGRANPKLEHFGSPGTRALKTRFYRSVQLWLPIIRRTPRWRIGKWTWRPGWEARAPYSADYGCFYGDHWFTANRRASRALIARDPANVALIAHLHSRTQGDECFYATVLGNHAELALCRDNKRFAEWHGGGAHPINLTEAELPDVLASGAFFARKVTEARMATLLDNALSRQD